MANGLDRLERFFTNYRRKGSVPTVEDVASLPVSRRPSAVVEQQFPSPSFIRPKASRMCARQEVSLRQANGRSPSVPDILTSRRSIRGHTRNAGSTGSSSSHRQRRLPAKSPSLNNLHSEPLFNGLRNFQFPDPESQAHSGRTSPSSPLSRKDSAEALHLPSPRSRSPLHMCVHPPPNRVDTPPSDPEDENETRRHMSMKKLPRLPHGAPPTPDESPELGPVPDHQLRSCKSADGIDKSLFRDMIFDLDESMHSQTLRKASSQASLQQSIRYSYGSSILREPDVREFLELSDDDIAEDTATESLESLPCVEPKQTLPPMGLSISQRPTASSLLTLTPPRASQPAAAAAFEAARIARRYDFDLVYVVNLWPGQGRPASFVTSDPSNDGSEKQLIGRLLAAHGLHHVPSPLQISSLVHTTILRSDGWIEYRNPDAQEHDLARGYACGFYTGQYARQGTPETLTPVSGVRLSEQIDRGIVFAAYRKPRTGDSKLGHTFTEQELGELHTDAEVLVEMLIDIHVANRLRQPPPLKDTSDETGPMPVQQPFLS